ncbi:MAG: PASTA domain-containing protein [Ignavibacteriae bacterium]|nr:MAG: PASTA domain-containing protein [Ignavibacteriota bacterium]
MNWWKKGLIIFVSVIALIFIMNSVIMPWYVKHNTLVKVPSVVGLSYNDALKLLEEGGLEGLQGDIRYDAAKPIGTILDQNPPAEQMVKDGRRIYLIVSGGEQLYDVPNLVGRTVRESKFILAQRNIELQETSYKSSVQFPPGLVIEQIEQPGAKVKKGTKIGVVVSTGMESGNLKVPDLTGKNLEEAKKILLQNKFAIGKINFQPSSSVPLNSVIDQYPKANSMAKENDKVDLFVNRIVVPKVPVEDEMNSIEEVPDEEKDEIDKPKDSDKDKKEIPKKEELKKEKKDDVTKDKKDSQKKDDKTKPTEKKKTDKPKDTDKDKKDDGTKF